MGSVTIPGVSANGLLPVDQYEAVILTHLLLEDSLKVLDK